jgi:hypothetical protein
MRTLTKPMVSLAVLAALVALPSGHSAAQSILVGGVAGRAESREVRDRAADSDTRSGFVVGAWTEVTSPVPFVGALAEAVWVRRGGAFPLGGPAGLRGDVESDWLAMTVAPVLRGGVGPVHLYVYGGPTVELPLRTRTAAELRSAYAAPTDQGFAVTAGAGLGVRSGRWSVQGEARRVEGLSTAYSGSAGDVRHRSTELLVRVARSRRASSGQRTEPPTPAPRPAPPASWQARATS